MTTDTKMTKEQFDKLKDLNDALERGISPPQSIGAQYHAYQQEVKPKPAMGGGLRYNSGKAEIHQVPTSNIFAIAKTLQYGAQKYAKGNFRKGMAWTTVYDCAMRHMMKWLDGEQVDEESGLPHLYHAITNIGFLIEYAETCPELDDRFTDAPINMSQDSFDKIQFNKYVKPEPK